MKLLAGRMNIALAADVAILVAVSALVFLHPVGNSDLFWQIKTGEWIWQHGSHPGSDIFSYAAYGARWVDPAWLAELMFYAVYKYFGFNGLSILSFTIGTSISMTIFCGLNRISKSPHISLFLATTIIILGAHRFQLLRPDLFAFLFFAIFVALLCHPPLIPLPRLQRLHGGQASREGGRGRGNAYGWLYLLIPIQILWANIHGSAVLGPFIVFAFAIGSRRLFALGFALIACMAVNPSTYHIYTYPIDHMMRGFTMREVSDWASPSFFGDRIDFGAWGMLIMAATAMAMMIARRRIGSLPLVILAAAFMVPSIAMSRFIPYEMILISYLLAVIARSSAPRDDEAIPGNALDCFAPHSGTRNDGRYLLAVIFLLVLTIALGGPPLALQASGSRPNIMIGRPFGVGLDRGEFPVEAADFLSGARIQGNMMNDMGYGGYLIFRLYPKKVFIDTRTMIYGDEFLKRYSSALFDESAFNRIAQEYGITHVIYDARQMNVPGGPLQFLRNRPDWKRSFESGNAVVYVQKE